MSGVEVDIEASLDKQAYQNGDTAVLALKVTKLSQTEDGRYIAAIRYGSHYDMQYFTLSSQPATLTFNVPLTSITGQRIFYSIHFESGNTIFSNSIALNETLADLVAGFSGEISDDRILTTEIRKDNTVEIPASVLNYGKAAASATSLEIYDNDSLLETKQINELNPAETTNTSTIWNVLGKAGTRTLATKVDPEDVVAEYSEENNSSSVYAVIPDMTIFTETGKDTYKIRQKAYITSTITNLTANNAYSNLLVLTSATNASGQEVYSKSIALGSLDAVATTTTAEAWNTSGLASAGTYTITQKLYAGSDLMAESAKQVTLETAPDFTLATDVNSRKVKQGEEAIYTASVDPFSGWNHEITFSMEGLPSGASASFTPDKLVPPAQSVAAVITTGTTTAGAYTLYLSAQGTDEGEIVTHSATLVLDVAGFGLQTAESEKIIKQLESAAYPVSVTALNGYEGTVSLSIIGLPNGTKATFDSPQLVVPGTSNFAIQTSKYAKPGTYTITVTGNDGLVSHALNLTLVLEPNPAIAAGIIATPGPGPQNEAQVRLYNANLQLVKEFKAFDTKYGANAISADIDGDGYDEIIVAQGPDPKNTALLKAFRQDGSLIGQYTVFDGKYGLTLASGDLDGDWTDELIVGTGSGPKNAGIVKVLKYGTEGFTEVLSLTINSQGSYGLNVASGDVDGDGLPEIITAPGPGPNDPASVTVWKYAAAGLTQISTFIAFDGAYGVTIAAGDTDGDGKAEIITGTGPDPKNAGIVRVYRPDGALVKELTPFNTGHDYGVSVAAGDLNGDNLDEIITGLGPGPQNAAQVKVFRSDGTEIGNFTAYTDEYGVKVSAGRVGL